MNFLLRLYPHSWQLSRSVMKKTMHDLRLEMCAYKWETFAALTQIKTRFKKKKNSFTG